MMLLRMKYFKYSLVRNILWKNKCIGYLINTSIGKIMTSEQMSTLKNYLQNRYR